MIFIGTLDRPADLVKMDVQGAEAQIIPSFLNGCLINQVRTWIVGTHGPRVFEQVKNGLSKHYKIVHADANPRFQPDGIVVATL